MARHRMGGQGPLPVLCNGLTAMVRYQTIPLAAIHKGRQDRWLPMTLILCCRSYLGQDAGFGHRMSIGKCQPFIKDLFGSGDIECQVRNAVLQSITMSQVEQ